MILVAVVVLATFVGGAFADTISTAPTRTTLQTTSVDIEAFQAETNGLQLLTCYPASICGGVSLANLTAGFSFAPAKNFVQINSVILTIIYQQVSVSSTPSTNTDALTVEVNGHSPTVLGMIYYCSSCVSSVSQPISPHSLNPGANTLNVGIAATGPNPSQANIYEVRLTVEYTFQG